MEKPDYQKNYEALEKLTEEEKEHYFKERYRLVSLSLWTKDKKVKADANKELDLLYKKYGFVPNNDGK